MSDLFDMIDQMDNDETVAPIIKAPFGYPGGKSRSVEKLQTIMPYRLSYIEPFGGSGTVLLSRHKSKLEVFNDRYSGVTDFYRVLRDKRLLDSLIERLDLTIHGREEWLMCKSTWQDVSDPVERAARWYYMISYSFGSLGRNFGRAVANSNPISGKIRNKLAAFNEIHNRFKDVQIENLDWRDVCTRYDNSQAVIYLDPPYLEVHTGTYKNEMSLADHQSLIGFCKVAKSTICLSGYSNGLYDSVNWDEKHEWSVNITAGSKNSIGNGKTGIEKSSTTALECLWIKYG